MISNKDVIILFIEDDEVDQLAMKRAFNKLKIKNTIVVANDGIEALEILREEDGGKLDRPFLVVLDLNLPRMNGHEFLKEIRSDEQLKDLVVFVMTTSKDEKDVVESYNMNVAGYVVKDNMADSFAEAVEMIDHFWRIVELPG